MKDKEYKGGGRGVEVLTHWKQVVLFRILKKKSVIQNY